jgi:membrane protease YdiL (CAAX protease family)
MAEKSTRVWARIGGVRLVLFFVLLALADFGPQVLTQTFLLNPMPEAFRPYAKLAAVFVIMALVIAVYRVLVRWLEQRPAQEIDIKPASFSAGALLAIVMFSAIYAIYFKLGAAHYDGLNPAPRLLGILAMVIVSGIGEELIFRGGVYRIVEDMFGSGVALVFSGALFGFLHANNPHATLLSSVAIAIEAGILLGAAYAVTRNLWLAIGIHMGWNFAEGGIFGASVSGGADHRGLLNISLSGPDWLTGGSFGPEASVVTMAICTAAGLYFVWRTIKTKRWVPLRCRMVLD